MNPKPGEVWLADLGLAAKTRPVVVVSRYDQNPPRALVTYVPLTTQNRRSNYIDTVFDLVAGTFIRVELESRGLDINKLI